MARRTNFREDEEMARRLQYEEHASLSSKGSADHGMEVRSCDRRSEQEQRDMELARQFAQMDMQHHQTSKTTEKVNDDPFDYSTAFQKAPRRHSNQAEKQARGRREHESGHRRRNTHADFDHSYAPALLQQSFQRNDVPSFMPSSSSSRRLARSHSPGSLHGPTSRGRTSKNREEMSPRSDNMGHIPRQSFDADLELARKMQNLEDMGMGRLNSDRAIDVDNDASAKKQEDTMEEEDIQKLLMESGTSMHDVPTEVLSELLGKPASPLNDRSTLLQRSPKTPAKRPESSRSLLTNSPKLPTSRMPTEADETCLAPLSPARTSSVQLSETGSESPSRTRRQSGLAPPPRSEPADPRNDTNDTPTAETLSTKASKKKKRGAFFRFGSKTNRSPDSDEAPELVEAHAVLVETIPATKPPGIPAAIPSSIPAAIPPPPGGSLSATRPPSGGPPAAIPPAPLGGPPRPRTPGVPFMGTNMCSACGLSHGTFLKVFDQKYHLECFRCSSCSGRIDPNDQFKYTTDEHGKRHVHHRECFLSFGATCSVCRQIIPATPDGKIPYIKHPFFKSEQICVWHSEEPLRRCWSCHRFEPKGVPFVDLMDMGRVSCKACHRTVVVENGEIAQLWQKVLDFFETHMQLPVWGAMRAMPIFLVGSEALQEQWLAQGSIHAVSSCLTTSGLCLTEVDRTRGGASFGDAIIGIICLTGLPRDLAGAVLAHEATHAWLRMHPKYEFGDPLPPQVEEGLSQLMSVLFLSEGLPPAANQSSDGPSDAKLRQFFKFTVEREKNDIFGNGYRMAAMAYSEFGIETLLTHVLQFRDFPRA